ncbi:hypothetical protein BTVI_154143 [Pitangus sulphuratus]|nr:hypothetical protein BTVI_154143 [Pitangus sulphuratus]
MKFMEVTEKKPRKKKVESAAVKSWIDDVMVRMEVSADDRVHDKVPESRSFPVVERIVPRTEWFARGLVVPWPVSVENQRQCLAPAFPALFSNKVVTVVLEDIPRKTRVRYIPQDHFLLVHWYPSY